MASTTDSVRRVRDARPGRAARLYDVAETIRVLDADTPSVRLDETTLAKILQDDVDRLARQTTEIPRSPWLRRNGMRIPASSGTP